MLYDYVHVLKCIRNNWLTEKMGELEYTWNGETMIAKWSVLKDLYSLESEKFPKLSKLNETAVFPKPIERQKVTTCLRIFCYETIAALENYPDIDQSNAHGTIQFLKIIVAFWKIVNTKAKDEDVIFDDPLRGVVESSGEPKLKINSVKN